MAKRLAVGVAMIAAAEVILRFCVGLGDPPLFIAHPSIDYMLKPNQKTRSLGRSYLVNEWGMRSESLPRRKINHRELRIVVMGDSVLNGGVAIDHGALATTRLERELSAVLEHPIRVANISAGGWGPQNQFAYLKTFGHFDADTLLLVLSSHDYFDVAAFVPLDLTELRIRKPTSALLDVFFRQLPSVVLGRSSAVGKNIGHAGPNSRGALSEIIEYSRINDLEFCIIYHRTQHELGRKELDAGGAEILELMQKFQVPVIDDALELQASLRRGSAVYVDQIHLTSAGHAALGWTLRRAVEACGRQDGDLGR